MIRQIHLHTLLFNPRGVGVCMEMGGARRRWIRQWPEAAVLSAVPQNPRDLRLLLRPIGIIN